MRTNNEREINDKPSCFNQSEFGHNLCKGCDDAMLFAMNDCFSCIFYEEESESEQIKRENLELDVLSKNKW